jgi:hypothetical protein
LVQLCENVRVVHDHVRTRSRELKKNKESIINGRQGTVTKSGEQCVDTTEDDQLIAPLNDAEMESVVDFCENRWKECAEHQNRETLLTLF